jgi:hypothetical protein
MFLAGEHTIELNFNLRSLLKKKKCQFHLKFHSPANWIDLTTACGTSHFITYKYHPNFQSYKNVTQEELMAMLKLKERGKYKMSHKKN